MTLYNDFMNSPVEVVID